MWGGNVCAGGEGLEEEEGGKGQERRTLVKLSCTRFHAARRSLARQISSPLVAWSLTFSSMAKTRYLSLLLGLQLAAGFVHQDTRSHPSLFIRPLLLGGHSQSVVHLNVRSHYKDNKMYILARS
ncbi:hypothetical protein K443DRAFT_176913 [Laccaria amethystina LaAM-08-1]|uniref:Uncharacterized protein n=1 Tax=Laccaria amethystina LaAM-08-1 TaxID=1095629 RepID=A0A0C9WNN9_9AGAR|nr:hypothetical protein K443DRAFT_176913 [Laccaria amethystina LaAM-08-1]